MEPNSQLGTNRHWIFPKFPVMKYILLLSTNEACVYLHAERGVEVGSGRSGVNWRTQSRPLVTRSHRRMLMPSLNRVREAALHFETPWPWCTSVLFNKSFKSCSLFNQLDLQIFTRASPVYSALSNVPHINLELYVIHWFMSSSAHQPFMSYLKHFWIGLSCIVFYAHFKMKLSPSPLQRAPR